MSQNLLLVYNQFTLDFKQFILTWLRNRCNESAFNEANSNWEKNVGKYLLFFQFFHKETFMHFTVGLQIIYISFFRWLEVFFLFLCTICLLWNLFRFILSAQFVYFGNYTSDIQIYTELINQVRILR